MKQQPQPYLEQLRQLLQQLEQAAPSLQQEIDATQQDFDAIANGLSEETSLKLQMAMDRSSKLIDTLSNIMINMSDVENSIVQNIK